MAHEETVYEALSAAPGDEHHWAFGTGFDDPLAGVDTTVPDDVDATDLGTYCLMLGDDALVLVQRLTEWITRAPELEEEVAIANIALDLLGQRSEEHTSELQLRQYLVCRLLLETKQLELERPHLAVPEHRPGGGDALR